MSIPRKQIGWSQESNLLWEISRQMEKLTGVVSTSGGGGGGGVQSVTGLDTDNTDPLNPIVQISVDGTTITGAGTPASPLIASDGALVGIVDLTFGDYTPNRSGIFIVSTFGSSNFIFPSVWNSGSTVQDGERITLINSQINAIDTFNIAKAGSVSNVRYQGTLEEITSIQSGMTYEFVYSVSLATWFCYNPQPEICPPLIDLSTYGNYQINSAGVYAFTADIGGNSISLPDPTKFNGSQIVIINLDNAVGIPLTNPYRPYRLTNSIQNTLNANAAYIMYSINGVWQIINT